MSQTKAQLLGPVLGDVNYDSGTLFVDSTNNRVGIGTDNPVYTLDVNGGIRSRGTLTVYPEVVANSTFNIRSVTGTAQYLWFTEHSVVDKYLIGCDVGSQDLVFRSGAYNFSTGTERLRIKSDGNVGIGTNNPTVDIELNKSASSVRQLIRNTLTTGYAALSVGADTGTLHIGFRGDSYASTYGVVGPGMGYIDGSIDNLGIQTVGNILFGTGTNTANIGEKVRITSSGNVGIGTDNPQQKLHVNGSIQIPDNLVLKLGEYGGSEHSIRYNTPTQPGIMFKTAGTDKMIITSGGNVGIGTNDPINADLYGVPAVTINGTNPTLNLNQSADLDADGTISSLVFAAKDPRTSSTVNGREMALIRARWVGFSNDSLDTDLIFYTAASNIAASSYERLRITHEGNVGIGTTNPTRKLHVGTSSTDALILVTGTTPQFRLNSEASDGNDATRAIFGLATATGQFFASAIAGDTILRTTDGGNLLFGEGLTERFRISSSGNVGIGVTNPSSLLDITTTSASSYTDGSGSLSIPNGEILKIRNLDTTTNNTAAFATFHARGNAGTMSIWYTGNTGGSTTGLSGAFVIGHRTGDPQYTERLRIDSSGNVGIGTTNPNRKLHVNGSAKIFDNDNNAAIIYENRFYHSMKGKVINTYNNSGTDYNLVRCIKSTNIQFFVEVTARSVNAVSSDASISVGYAMVRWLGGNFITSTIHQNLTTQYNAGGGARFTLNWVADGNNYILRAQSTGTGYYSTMFDVIVHNRDAGYVDFFDAPVFNG